MPLIIVLYLVGFGVPGLRLQGVPTRRSCWARALVLTYSAYVAEVFRAGIESVHPSQRAAARSLGLTYRQTHAARGAAAGRAPGHAAAAQRLRRAAEGRRPDLGARRRSTRSGPRRSRSRRASTSRRTSWPGLLFVLLAIPLDRGSPTAVTLRGARRRQQSGGAAVSRVPVLDLPRAWSRCSATNVVLRRPRPRRRRAPGGRADRRVRARASRPCCAASTCSRRSTTARSRSTARTSPIRASTPTGCAGGSAWSSRRTTCFRT